MDFPTKMYVRAREGARAYAEGQTMTEYALILAAVAVVVFAAYQLMGSNINTLSTKIDSALSS